MIDAMKRMTCFLSFFVVLAGISAVSCGGSKTVDGLDECGIWSLEYVVNDFGDTTNVAGLSSTELEGLYHGEEPNVITGKSSSVDGKASLVLGVFHDNSVSYDLPVFRLRGALDVYIIPAQPTRGSQVGSMKFRTEKDSVVCDNLLILPEGIVTTPKEDEAKKILALLKEESAETIEFRFKGTAFNTKANYTFAVTEEQMTGFNKVYVNYKKKRRN